MNNSELRQPSASFHKKMSFYADEYGKFLLVKSSNGSAISRSMIIRQFVNYLWQQHGITNLKQVTVSMANSQFYAKYKQMNDEITADSEIKTILKDFFTFVHDRYGIRNARMMKGFEQRIKS